jgi:hypothetical protein
MNMKYRMLILILVLVPIFHSIAFADPAVKELTIAKSASTIPKVVHNDFSDEWLVVWVNSSSHLVGRRVLASGEKKQTKSLLDTAESGPIANTVAVAYDSTNHKYLVCFVNSSGLNVQRLDRELRREGSAQLIRAGTIIDPQVMYNADQKSFYVFWVRGKSIYLRILNQSGSPTGGTSKVGKSPNGHALKGLNLAAMPNQNAFLMTRDEEKAYAFTVAPNGQLLHKPLLLGKLSEVDGLPDAAFLDTSNGFVAFQKLVESQDTSELKVRKISPNGKFDSASHTVADNISAGDESIVFDSKRDRFLIFWSSNSFIKGAGFNQTDEPLKGPFFVFDNTDFHAVGPTFIDSAIDPKTGRAFVVWLENHNNVDFSLSAAIVQP